jgi:hypothetical protein
MATKPKIRTPIKPMLPESEVLSRMQSAFCLNCVELKVERSANTYGIAIEAYRRAGYKRNANTGSKQDSVIYQKK